MNRRHRVPWMALEAGRWAAARMRLPYRFSALYTLFLRPARRDAVGRAAARRPSVRERMPSLKLLVVGQQDFGSTGWQRSEAFSALFGLAESLDTAPLVQGLGPAEQIRMNHLYTGERIRRLNEAVLEKARAFSPDILWVEKGLHLWPETLEGIRQGGCRLLIHFSPDNQRVFANQSRHYLRALPVYGLHVTTKPGDVPWLLRCGARDVRCMGKGFDPEIHRPQELSPPERERFGCEVGFAGHWEPWRERLLLKIAQQGHAVKVFGGGWRRARFRRHPLFSGAEHLAGPDYAKALCGAKINLCLLSRWFGDRTTARSVEIPACGGFLLAERTPEHEALFREGAEAAYYSSEEEMFRKIGHYLNHEEERRSIAQAGRKRCLAGYSHRARLEALFESVPWGG